MEANRVAEELLTKAAAAEPEITAMLQGLESDQAHLAGLEFRLKSQESLVRKLISNAEDMEVSIRETVPAIWDVIRYTMVVDDEMYTPVVKSIISALEEKGCSIAKFRNFWSADDYRGINMAFTTAGDDRFELQFHTPESYDTKQNKTHEYYEILRSEEATEEEKKEALEKEIEIVRNVPVPEGAVEIKYDSPV